MLAPTARLGPAYSQMSRLFRAGFISLADQAILSLSNFVVGVLLVQNTSKADYGLYVIAYAAILFAVSVQNALITTPMTVLAPGKSGAAQERYCGALALGQYLIFLPLAIVVMLAAGLSGFFEFVRFDTFGIVVAVAGATLVVNLREFMRSWFFMRLWPAAVLGLDLGFVALLLAGMALIVAFSHSSAMPLLALVVLALSSLLSGVVAMSAARLSLRHSFAVQREALYESWPLGKWALGGVSVTWLQDQSYVYLVALLVGAAGTAEANAARLLLMPLMLLNVGINRITMPYWVRLRALGRRSEIGAMSSKIQAAMIAAVVAYVAGLMVLKNVVVPLVLTVDYESIGDLVILWGAVTGLQIIRSNLSIMLQVYHRFRQITLVNAVSALIVVLLGVYLTARLGVAGSLLALLVGEIALVLSLAYVWRQAA